MMISKSNGLSEVAISLGAGANLRNKVVGSVSQHSRVFSSRLSSYK
jgi:hypothetical protein